MSTSSPPNPSTLVAHASDARDDLVEVSMEQAEILAGSPVARSLKVAELGDGMSVWLWDCTAGRFRWHFGACDEVVHVVEGAVTVTDEHGVVVRLTAGDVATFGAGTSPVWEVEEYVKKVAVLRSLPRDPVSRLIRGLRRLGKRLLRRG